MARPDLTGSTYNTYPWRGIWGPGAIEIGGQYGSDPQEINPTRIAGLGLTNGGISINPNSTLEDRFSDQLYGAHSGKITTRGFVVSANVDNMDIWNLALLLSYAQSEVSGSSQLQMDNQVPDDYHCLRVTTEGSKQNANSTASTLTFDFWRVMLMGGEFTLERETPASIPFEAHCYVNSEDIFGNVKMSEAWTGTAPLYENA